MLSKILLSPVTFLQRMIGKLLPNLPPRWQKVGAAFIAFLIAFSGAVTYDKTANNGPDMFMATAITRDGRDINLRVSRDGKTRQEVTALYGNKSEAPLMTWENKDIREGKLMKWCLSELDKENKELLTDTLNTLAQRFPKNIKWTEDCTGASYTAGLTSNIDCGEDSVACAIYYGERSGRVSINQKLIDAGNCTRGCKRVAWAHETQHLVMNLDHNACGKTFDPITGQPVPSVMTAIYIPDGPTCSDPPAYGLAEEDWPKAIKYYNLKDTKNDPTPTPTPTPKPIANRAVIQKWDYVGANKACQTPAYSWDNVWCVTDIVAPEPAIGGSYYVLMQRYPDGGAQYLSEFKLIEP